MCAGSGRQPRACFTASISGAMDLLALIGVVLIVLGVLGYVPLVLGLVLGVVLLFAGAYPRVSARRW